MTIPLQIDEFAPPEGRQPGSAFLGEALGSFAERTGGGRPTTVQGQEFVLDFFERFGTAPTPQQLADFKSGQIDRNFQFLPGSTSFREFGFENVRQLEEAQGFGETFGPGAGAGVPRGGTVLTREGVPFLRTFDPQRFEPQIRAGQFVEPPATGRFDLEALFGEVPQGQDIPGVFRPPRPEFGQPTEEQTLRNFSPVQVFQARLQDFLTNQVEQDAARVRELVEEYEAELALLGTLPQRGAGGEVLREALSPEQIEQGQVQLDAKYIALLDELFNQEKADEVLAEAQRLVDQGLSPEEIQAGLTLPEGDVQGTIGAQLGGLLTQGADIERQRFEAANVEPLTTQDVLNQRSLAAQADPRLAQILTRIPPQTIPPQEAPLQTGTEQSDYFTIIEGMGLAPEIKQVMFNRYQEFLFAWFQTGPQIPFIDWIREQMRGG